MAEVKHTPTSGPWWIAGKGTIRYGNPNSIDTGWVASVHWRNRDANAFLIAAAPDMLEVLKFLLCVDFDRFTEHDETLLDSVLVDARAAINAAEGR